MRIGLDEVQQEISVALRLRLPAGDQAGSPPAGDVRAVLADLGLYRLELPGDAGGLQYGLSGGVVVCGELGRAGCADDYRAAAFLADLAADAGSGPARELLLKLAKEPPAVAVADGVVAGAELRTGALLDGAVTLAAADRAAQWIVLRARVGDTQRWAAVAAADRGVSVAAGVTLDGAADRLGGPHPNAAGRAADPLDRARVRQAAYLTGLATGAHHLALGRGQQRRQFGAPVGEHQAVAFALARQFAELEAVRLLVYRAAWLADNHMPVRGPAMEVLAYASETARQTLRLAMQVHGAYGLTRRAPISRYYLAAETETVRWGRPQELWREAAVLRRAGAASSPPHR
jgi:alkylation response protein AidB-like acyl-CoA dehydrogenase